MRNCHKSHVENEQQATRREKKTAPRRLCVCVCVCVWVSWELIGIEKERTPYDKNPIQNLLSFSNVCSLLFYSFPPCFSSICLNRFFVVSMYCCWFRFVSLFSSKNSFSLISSFFYLLFYVNPCLL